MMDHLKHEALLDVRDFLMRAALYQATEFGRVEVRKEARQLLKALDSYLHEDLDEQDEPIAPEKVPDTPDVIQHIPQGERPVNQGEIKPNFARYFPRKR